MSQPTIELVVRGDDAGGSFSANRAIEQAAVRGAVRNVSVMATGPAVDDAATRFAACSHVCIGLHVTLNSEWQHPRFRPVLPAEQVPSLVGADGCFLPSPKDLAARGFDLDEATREVHAQLQRLRSLGLHIGYLDEHMLVGNVGGLADRLTEICREQGLVHARRNAVNLPRAPSQMSAALMTADERVQSWVSRIEAAAPGRYVLATHPLFDDGESRAIYRETNPPGTVALDRDRDRQAVIDPRLMAAFGSLRVKLVRYTDPTSF